LAATVFVSCRSSKNYLERSDSGKALKDAVKTLQKNPDDEKAAEAIPILYQKIKTQRLANIKALEKSSDANRWEKLLTEYESLQDAYETLMGSTAAFRLTNPESYSVPLLE